MQLKGLQAIVTGGTKRVGRAFTDRLVAEGAEVVITYRTSEAEAKALTQNPKVKSVQLDLSDAKSIQKAVLSIKEMGFKPSLLINNASTFYPKKLSEVTEKDWEELHASNVKGHFFFTQGIVPLMSEGVILNLVDIHAEQPLKNFSAYVTQKASLKMLTKNLALELAPKIRVNSISPGSILFPEGFSEEQKAKYLQACLLKREGSPQDLVEAALFLIRNDYVTGIDLKVDGGSSLSLPL